MDPLALAFNKHYERRKTDILDLQWCGAGHLFGWALFLGIGFESGPRRVDKIYGL